MQNTGIWSPGELKFLKQQKKTEKHPTLWTADFLSTEVSFWVILYALVGLRILYSSLTGLPIFPNLWLAWVWKQNTFTTQTHRSLHPLHLGIKSSQQKRMCPVFLGTTHGGVQLHGLAHHQAHEACSYKPKTTNSKSRGNGVFMCL